ncbi:MAG: type VI secretion system-associated protein TagF [Desulfobacterales bacterium]|nr:type VI secretion system-associated protein TagF [Desulfobacterales bacterium]
MLGFLKSDNTWKWTAFGKHPVVRDFFTVGSEAAILRVFSNWLENGYNLLDPTQKRELYSWRFWIKGPRKNSFICGVGRDSSDSLGRPYPFMVMGTGYVKKGEKNWDFLPFAFEKTWNQMDSMNLKRKLAQIENQVSKISQPTPLWPDYKNQRIIPNEFRFSNDQGDPLPDIKIIAESLQKRTDFFIRLEKSDDMITQAGILNYFLKKHTKGIPQGVFIGGPPDEDYLAVFKQPPSPGDFKKLWSANSKGNEEYGSLVFG